MIRRLFYMALGAYATVWVQRRLRALRPDHVARRAAGQLTGFAADVRQQARDREIELRARYGLDTVDDRPVSERPHLPPHVRDGR